MKMNKEEFNMLLDRENELWQKAVSRMLDKTDWEISDWLDEEDQEEYAQVRRAIDNAPQEII